MSGKIQYWTPDRVELLRENCNEPRSKILKFFKGKTWKAIRHIMENNKIYRDRDKSPNKTKGPKKWTPEKLEYLRQHRNDDLAQLAKDCGISISRLLAVMSINKIPRDKPESILWSEEADRIIIEAAIQSHQYNTKKGEGRRQLWQLREEVVRKLKEVGFKGHTSNNAISLRVASITTERLKQLGFFDKSAPLGWGAPIEMFGRNKETKDLQPTSKDWFKILEEKNPVRFKEFKEKFLERFKSDYRLSGNFNADLLKEWPECPTEDGLRFGASFLGENRSRLKISAEIKTPEQVGRIIEKRLVEIVKSGSLVTTDVADIFKQIKIEFQSVTSVLTLDSFKVQLFGIIWDKSTLENLENCIRLDILSDFSNYNKHIPRKMIDDKVKELRGKSATVQPISFRRGLGRILDETSQRKDEKFKLPESTFRRPFKIITKKNEWTVAFPNAPNIGTLYNPLMKENPLWQAFAGAEASKYDALFLANILDLDTRKASGSAAKIYRSLFSGLEVNLEIIDPDYRKQAAEIIDKSPANMVLYETIAEAFHDLMSGLKKILNYDPNQEKEKLQYSGKIYIVLTKNEQDIVVKAAYMEERYITLTRIAELNVIKNMLTKQVAYGQASQEELDKILKEVARTIISLVHSQEDRRFYNRVLAFMVREIEKSLGPNCQVIGMGTSYVEINGLRGELHIPKKETVTDGHLKDYAGTFGGKSYLGQMPDFAVVLPSYPLCARNGERERYVEGQRLMPTKIWVAPPLLDGKFLRRALNNNAYTIHNLTKAVASFQFEPGLLCLEYSNRDLNSHYLPVKKTKKDSRETYQGKFLVLMFGTDPHWGGRSKFYIYDPIRRLNLGMSEAGMEMMRRGGLFQPGKMPIHGFNMLDDGIQARNFETQYEPSPNQMSNTEIEKYLAEIEEKIQKSTDLKEIKKISSEKDHLVRNQFALRGSDYPKHQMDEVFNRHIEPNVDFFDALISRVKDSGVNYRGLSEITKKSPDTRDVGAVNYPNGNHFGHTVWGALTEGEFYKQKLQDKLKALDRWRNDHATIDKLVRAPIFSSEFFALGRIALPGGYEYGVDFRGTPPRFASWGDTLLGWVRNDIFTGDMEGHMSGLFTIAACGDKHFFCSTYTSYKFYHMSASGSHTDQYGKKGFSPNNTGISFVLLPVDGPENGPIITRTFSATYMENYFKNPFKFDWETCFPNPL